MAIIAPKGRTHLAADALFRLGRSRVAPIPDHRQAEGDMAFTDALMAGFAVFSRNAPSLLAFDTQRVEGNVTTIYGRQHVPRDTARRERRAPVSPESRRPVLRTVLRQLQRGKALEERVLLDGYSLLALDGTGDFSAPTIPCDACLHKVHRHGAIPYDHHVLGAVMLHPDRRAVLPLMPEPILTHEGTEKNDCERKAAKRFLATLRHDHPHRKCIVTADRLRSHAPHIATLHDAACHSLLGVQEGDHPYVFNQGQAAEDAGAVTSYARHDRTAGVVHRFRLVNAMPRNASRADVRVNFIE